MTRLIENFLRFSLDMHHCGYTDTTTEESPWEMLNFNATSPTANTPEVSTRTPALSSLFCIDFRGPSGKKKISSSYPLPPQMQNSSPFLNKCNFSYDDRILSVNEGY
jgi:hypothetical protein